MMLLISAIAITGTNFAKRRNRLRKIPKVPMKIEISTHVGE
jgi:hypothetical protein